MGRLGEDRLLVKKDVRSFKIKCSGQRRKEQNRISTPLPPGSTYSPHQTRHPFFCKRFPFICIPFPPIVSSFLIGCRVSVIFFKFYFSVHERHMPFKCPPCFCVNLNLEIGTRMVPTSIQVHPPRGVSGHVPRYSHEGGLFLYFSHILAHFLVSSRNRTPAIAKKKNRIQPLFL